MAPQSLTGSKGLEGQAAGVRMGHLPGSSLSPDIRNGSLLGRGSSDPPIGQPGEPWRTSCGPSGGRARPPSILTKDGCLSQPPDDFVAGRAMHRHPTRGSLCYVFPFPPFFPPQMLINPLPLRIDPCSGGSCPASVVSSTFLQQRSIVRESESPHGFQGGPHPRKG